MCGIGRNQVFFSRYFPTSIIKVYLVIAIHLEISCEYFSIIIIASCVCAFRLFDYSESLFQWVLYFLFAQKIMVLSVYWK